MKFRLIIAILFIQFLSFSQKISGEYSYSHAHGGERVYFHKNGTFDWSISTDLGNPITYHGTFERHRDTIRLYPYPLELDTALSRMHISSICFQYDDLDSNSYFFGIENSLPIPIDVFINRSFNGTKFQSDTISLSEYLVEGSRYQDTLLNKKSTNYLFHTYRIKLYGMDFAYTCETNAFRVHFQSTEESYSFRTQLIVRDDKTLVLPDSDFYVFRLKN